MANGHTSSARRSHFRGYTPRGVRVDDFFPAYPTRVPLLGNLTTSPSTITAEVHAADAHGLDFFSMLFYGGDRDCGHNADPNLRFCLDSSLAFMLNSSAVWEGVTRMHFFITYSNDIDRGRGGMFVGPTGLAAWLSLVGTWVRAMAHPHYLRVGGRPVFQILIPDIFAVQCGGNATLADALLGVMRDAGVAAGVGEPLIGGGWQNPSVPARGPDAPLPHPDGFMIYNLTDVPCSGCDIHVAAGLTRGSCEGACNATGACTAAVFYANGTCVLKSTAGPGASGEGVTLVRVLPSIAWEWTGTYNDAAPVCPGQPNWECPQYTNSWWPNATADGAQVFAYAQVLSYQADARGNHSQDTVPYLPSLIAGFDPRPWEEESPSFTPPTATEWHDALTQVRDLISAPHNTAFGFPDATSDTGIQPAVCIYAWNELGEGGILAPTVGQGYTLLEGVGLVFGAGRRDKS